MAEEFMVRVESEKLETAAEQIRGQILRLNTAFEGMTEAINRTNGYWIGEAADAHRRVFLEQKTGREEAIARLTEQASDLLQMAGVYLSTENENVQIVQSLLGDVIL